VKSLFSSRSHVYLSLELDEPDLLVGGLNFPAHHLLLILHIFSILLGILLQLEHLNSAGGVVLEVRDKFRLRNIATPIEVNAVENVLNLRSSQVVKVHLVEHISEFSDINITLFISVNYVKEVTNRHFRLVKSNINGVESFFL
jgi:hypothetical protein